MQQASQNLKTFFSHQRPLLFAVVYILFSFVLLIVQAEPVYAATISRPVNNLGLIAYWDFDVGKGGDTAYDRSGNGNDGTLDSVESDEWVSGKSGQAIDFDASGATLPDNVFQSQGSFAAWVNPAFNATDGEVIDILYAFGTNVDNDGMQLRYEFRNSGSANDAWAVITSNSSSYHLYANGQTFSAGTWIHLVVTWDFDADQYQLYVDNVLEDTDSSSLSRPTQTNASLAGTGSLGYRGLMDDVRIYNRVLSESEIRRLYNSGQVAYSNLGTTPVAVQSGLVGHWTFDGPVTSAGGTDDASGNGNNGSFSGGLSSSDVSLGVLGQALEFDGDDDYVNTGSGTSLDDLSLTDFAISAWIYANTTGDSGTGRIAAKRPSGGAGGWLFFTDNTSSIGAQILNTSGGVYAQARGANNALTLGQWQHVVMNFSGSGSNIDLYVDAAEISYDTDTTGSGTLSGDSSGNLLIGDSPAAVGARNFDGKIDDFRIYDRALSMDEIRRLYNIGAASKFSKTPTNHLTDGLVGHWSFDGSVTSAGGTGDVSGNGNNGSFNGGLSNTDAAIGRLGQALEFDGSDDYIDANGPVLDPTDEQFTIASWINIKDLDSNSYIAGKRENPPNSGYAFAFRGASAGDPLLLTIFNVVDQDSGASGIAAGEWVHIAVTYNKENITFYKDGAQLSSHAQTGEVGDASGISLLLGNVSSNGSPTASAYFNGQMDDVRIYNRALSADEVFKLYNMGR